MKANICKTRYNIMYYVSPDGYTNIFVRAAIPPPIPHHNCIISFPRKGGRKKIDFLGDIFPKLLLPPLHI